MPKYHVYVPHKYYSVYQVEASSPEEAISNYYKGNLNYDEDYLYDTDCHDTLEDPEVEEITNDE